MCSFTILMFHLRACCTQAPIMVSGGWPYMHCLWHTTFGIATFWLQVESDFYQHCFNIVSQVLMLFGVILYLTHGRNVQFYDLDVPHASMLYRSTNSIWFSSFQTHTHTHATKFSSYLRTQITLNWIKIWQHACLDRHECMKKERGWRARLLWVGPRLSKCHYKYNYFFRN